jgi:hypothetical protein
MRARLSSPRASDRPIRRCADEKINNRTHLRPRAHHSHATLWSWRQCRSKFVISGAGASACISVTKDYFFTQWVQTLKFSLLC